MEFKGLAYLKNVLSEKRGALASFRDSYGEKLLADVPQPYRLSSYTIKGDSNTLYYFAMNEVPRIQTEMAEQGKARQQNLKKLVKLAVKSLDKRKEREERERHEVKKGQINIAKVVSAAVYKSFWQTSFRILKFLQEKKFKLKQKKIEERKINNFLRVQSELADEILADIKSTNMSFASSAKMSALAFENEEKSFIVHLKKLKYKKFELNFIEEKVKERPETAVAAENQANGKNFPLSLFRGQLRTYQRIGVEWLNTLSMKRISCILADEMGLGKTVQTIAHLSFLAEVHGIWGPHLIVVPTTVLGNWIEELHRFLPAMKVFAYYGRSADRKQKRKGWSELDKFNICLTTYRIISIDAKIFKRRKWFSMILDEAHIIKNPKTQCFITLQKLRTFNRILLTGTPLQNRLQELWTLMTFLFPKKFGQKNLFCSNFDFYLEKAAKSNSNAYNNIIKKLHSILRPLILRRLKKDVEKQLPKKIEKIVLCDLSRRQKYLYDQFIMNSSVDERKLNGFVQSLNALMQLRKICNHPDLIDERISQSAIVLERIPFAVPLILDFEAYKACQKKVQVSIMQASGVLPKVYLVALMCLLHRSQKGFIKLNKHEIQHQRFSNRHMTKRILANFGRKLDADFLPFSSSFDFCSFDLKKKVPLLFEDVIHLNDHIVSEFENFIFQVTPVSSLGFDSPLYKDFSEHGRTIFEYNCNTVTPIPKIFVNNVNSFINDAGKMKRLYHLLIKLRKNNKKVLIFTQMSKMLNFLETMLSAKGFTYVRLDGSIPTEKRQAKVTYFNENPKIMIFISSTRVGGVGINLTAADTVIFYDCDWNPAVDKQAQDRCHRIGQNRDVTVYKLISKYTIEENILMTSNIKSKMDDLVLNKGQFNLQELFTSMAKSIDKEKQGSRDYNELITSYLNQVEEETDRVDDDKPRMTNQISKNEIGENIEEEPCAENEFEEENLNDPNGEEPGSQEFGTGDGASPNFNRTKPENEQSHSDAIQNYEEEIKLTQSVLSDVAKYGIFLLKRNIKSSDELEENCGTHESDDKEKPEMEIETEHSDNIPEDELFYKEVLAKRTLNMTSKEVQESIAETRKRFRTGL
jgi:SNF2 family DNA or RNA helicase